MHRSRSFGSWFGRLLAATAVVLFVAAYLAPILSITASAMQPTGRASPFVILALVGLAVVAVVSIAAHATNQGHGHITLKNILHRASIGTIPSSDVRSNGASARGRLRCAFGVGIAFTAAAGITMATAMAMGWVVTSIPTLGLVIAGSTAGSIILAIGQVIRGTSWNDSGAKKVVGKTTVAWFRSRSVSFLATARDTVAGAASSSLAAA